ncbi:MAG: MFS transporter [Betaproteobacteria bacterium]|nr:MFS transporter [Betaproteobacteria bacterium]
MASESSAAHVLRMVWPFGLAYAMSYALRTINAVLAPNLVDELSLSASELGLLASAYFLSFALMQIPLGAWLDRDGPRRVESLLLLLAIAGSALTATAQSFWVLWVGRALIGIGVSACLMAAYKAYRMSFSEQYQAPLASVMLMLGSLGALAATLPVEWLLNEVGWRHTFWILSGLFVVSWLAIRFRLPELRPEKRVGASLWGDALVGLKTVARHSEFTRLLPFAVLTYGGFLAMQSLWLGPWLTKVEGLSDGEAAAGLFVLTAVIAASHFATAWIARALLARGRGLNGLMHGGQFVLASLCASSVLGLWPHPLWGWGLAFVAAGTSTLSYSRFALAFPPEFSARATTAFNFLIFLGAFGVQWGIGVLIDGFSGWGLTTPMAMRAAVGCWVLSQFASLAWMIWAPSTRAAHPVRGAG